MVSTRSSTKNSKGQAKLEDFNVGSTSAASKSTASEDRNSTEQPKAKSKGQKRKQQQQVPRLEPVESDSGSGSGLGSGSAPPPRPSAANAAAIKGNSAVSPSLPEASKRRKPNAASLAPQQSEEAGGGVREGGKKPKPKSGGRNVDAQAKRAAERQRVGGERGAEDGEDREGGDGEGGEVVEAEGEDGSKKPIMINRSPVLQLWGACVAEFLHGNAGEVGWETCLSMGAAIAALCAVSKGKAIGKIEPKEQTDEQAAKKEDKKQKALQDSEEYQVMGFPLHVKSGKAQVSGAPKNASEGQLIGKFGGQENFDRVREVMKGALESWKGHDVELDKKAFEMYEKFRPNVPAGGGGWGKKGELKPVEVENTVKRS